MKHNIDIFEIASTIVLEHKENLKPIQAKPILAPPYYVVHVEDGEPLELNQNSYIRITDDLNYYKENFDYGSYMDERDEYVLRQEILPIQPWKWSDEPEDCEEGVPVTAEYCAGKDMYLLTPKHHVVALIIGNDRGEYAQDQKYLEEHYRDLRKDLL